MFKKIMVGMFFIVALVLTACGGTSETEVAPTVVEEELATIAPQETPSPTPTSQAVTTEDGGEPDSAAEPSCVPNAPKPTPSAEAIELFGPDPETDWIKGPQNAAVTILEYGDFQ